MLFWGFDGKVKKEELKIMKRNVAKTAHAKGLALLLAAGMLVSQMSGVSADAKAKKPKLSRTKVSVTVGKTKKVTVKNAKKVTWKVTKKSSQNC